MKKYDIEIEKLDKNQLIFCNKMKYKTKEYLDKINNSFNDLLDDEIYNYCWNCNKKVNAFFCLICNKNIGDNCFEECDLKEHYIQNLDESE